MVLLGLLVVAAGTPHTYAWTFLYLWVIVLARWSSSSWYLLAAAVTPPLVGIALVLLGEGHGVSVTLVHGLFLAAQTIFGLFVLPLGNGKFQLANLLRFPSKMENPFEIEYITSHGSSLRAARKT